MDTEAPETEAAAPAKAKKQESWRDTLRFLLFLFIGAVLLRSFIVAPFNIPSGSMLPRMMIGDYLVVAKWPYGYSRYSFPFGILNFDGRMLANAPERGDVVVFRYPGTDEDWVKRVIGLPGDTVQMRDGQLILNGESVAKTRIADFLVERSPNSPCRFIDPSRSRELVEADGSIFCAYPRYRETLPGGRSYEVIDQADIPADDTQTVIVPEGHYFMMGDNRDDSLDSRFSIAAGGVGLLPDENLLGRALVTYFSTDGSAEWLKPWTWFSAARWDRVGDTY